MPFDPSKPVSADNYDDSHGTYNITPYAPCLCCVEMKATLALGEDETTRIYINEGCCGEKDNQVRARPYAQLGSVDVSMQNNCCCCGPEVWMVATDGGEIAPAGKTGNCCNPTDKGLVEEISRKLQERKVLRGNIGLMKLHNANGDKLARISAMVDALVGAKAAGQPPPLAITMARDTFPTVTYDVQNLLEVPCCCRGSESYATRLTLEDDEVVLTTRTPCSQQNSRRPYAQLGVVTTQEVEAPCQCDLWSGCAPVGGHAVEIDAWVVTPKLGMETELCKTIATDLQARKVALGNIGQLKKGEQIREVVEHLEVALPSLLAALGVEAPPVDVEVAATSSPAES